MTTEIPYDAVVRIYLYQELVGLIVFPILNRFLGPSNSWTLDWAEILKGMFERLVLFTALIHGYPQMLIAFGAMKLGTRLHDKKDSPITNTYFLVGNLLSIFLAMISAIVVSSQ